MNTENTLLMDTLRLLQNRSAKIMLKQISADTNLSYSWICAFHNEKVPDYKHPKVEAKIRKLHDYLVSLAVVN